MRVPPIFFGLLVIILFMGTILGFQSAGVWSISGKITGDGQAVQPEAGDVNTIKGWMTLAQVTTTFNIPLTTLLQQFNLPADTPAETALKDLESDTFDVTALRDWLIAQQDGEQQAIEQPAQQETPQPTAEPLATLTEPEVANPAPTATVHIPTENTLTGKTTFQELYNWGLSQETIQKMIGEEPPLPGIVIKDYAVGKGMEFSTLKTQIQAELDKLP